MSAPPIVNTTGTQATRERLNRRAAEAGRSIFEILRETIAEAEERCEALRRTGDPIKVLQEQSVLDELSEVLMDEINEEIYAMHREQAEARQSA
jgi:alkanesulfonate monooxygenase SsuD/methylene tetrahydromethanopterin reductase-like flavin-dependent oxidoreductase (luciferase family)